MTENESGQLTLMVTIDQDIQSIYLRALSQKWYGEVASSFDEAIRFLKSNRPCMIFIDHNLPNGQSHKLVNRLQSDVPPLIIVYLAEDITISLALQLWGKVKELVPRPVTLSTLKSICEKYCLSPDNPVAIWKIALQMISQQYSNENLSEKVIANKLGLTPEYFSRLFKSRVGKSFRDTLNDTRIQTAKKLLGDTNLHIKEIAHKVGFSRSDSFVKNFQKNTRESPTGYRRRIKLK